MRVAVLGGGMQGCCAALALAEKGIAVTLLDKNDRLLSRTAVANEGKIHLGYMYAGDPSLATARMMMRGALAFGPFFARHLDGAYPLARDNLAQCSAYLVHRDSQRSADEIEGYLAAVHTLIEEAAQGREKAYFGIDLDADPKCWTSTEIEAEFNSALILAAFDTAEVAINPMELAAPLRDRIANDTRIETCLSCTVQSAEEEKAGIRVRGHGPDGPIDESYDHVVNALWDGRLAINKTFGMQVDRPWLHRLKYGVSFKVPNGELSRSATIILGPFGEVVAYPDGLRYLTWYPTCLHGISNEVAPPDWPNYPADPLRSRVINETIRDLGEIVPSLESLDPNDLTEVAVRGGVIVAWGETDIYDPASELHRRFEIGVTSSGQFHSIDPGKLTMAPYFADICASRIAG